MMPVLRTCRVCGKEARTEEELKLFVKDKGSMHGRALICLTCRSVEYKEYDLGGDHGNRWKSNIKRKYGITVEKYNEMFEAQEGCCGICSKHQTEFKQRLHVDHCHDTGEVRGLLCRQCNLLIGSAYDNVDILKKAITYLEEREK